MSRGVHGSSYFDPQEERRPKDSRVRGPIGPVPVHLGAHDPARKVPRWDNTTGKRLDPHTKHPLDTPHAHRQRELRRAHEDGKRAPRRCPTDEEEAEFHRLMNGTS